MLPYSFKNKILYDKKNICNIALLKILFKNSFGTKNTKILTYNKYASMKYEIMISDLGKIKN